jgi:hypothetical protein
MKTRFITLCISVILLIGSVGVVSISKAEVLNLELQCDGRIDLIFSTFEGQNNYETAITTRDFFRSIMGLELKNDKEFYHSERISITNNKLAGIFELQVDENLIYLNEESVKQINNRIKENISNEPIWSALSDYDFYLDIKFELDRYTGSLATEFEVVSKETIINFLNQFLSEEQAKELADVSGLSFNAQCKKLEEKLF